MRTILNPLLGLLMLAGIALPIQAADLATLQQQVMDTERAFAKTMADRDFAAFRRFVADEAVFQGGKVLHGKAAVLASWQRLFSAPQAPFSWRPESVDVLESGTLALSRGPVFDPSGKLTGRFNSVWRREGEQWRIVFDFGNDVCEPAATP